MLQCMNKDGKIWAVIMSQLCEMLNAVSLQHGLSQEVGGNSPPQSLSCPVLLCLSDIDEFLQRALPLSNC